MIWKVNEKYLKTFFNKTETELTIKNIFRFCEGYNLIEDWTKWSNYNDARNNTSHEYYLTKARLVMEIIPNFLDDVKSFLVNMENTLNGN